MKRVVSLLFISLIILHTFSQVCIYGNDSLLKIEIDFYLEKFVIYNCWPSLYNDIDTLKDELEFLGEGVVVSEPFSKGRINKEGKVITCFDSKLNRIYKFEIVDQFTLKSIKNTALYKKEDLLQIESMFDKESGFIKSMSWKKGKKSGIWNIQLNDSIIKKVLYESNQLKDSIFFNVKSQKYLQNIY